VSFNLAVILSETAQASPDRPAAVFDGGRLSFRQLDQASDRLAGSLAALGIKPGDRVALQLPNIPQFLISYFGILKAGGIVVPLNVMLKAPETAFHLGDSGARLLITWEGILAEAAKGAEAAGLDQVYAVGHAGDSGAAIPFEGLLGVAVPHFEIVSRQPLDTAVIVYTSGTTGRPKGAEAAVVGVPDERLGEEVMAVVILRPSVVLLEHELVSYCRERLAAYKCPRIFQFRAELPKNTLGKVLKDELARAYGALS